MTLKEYLETRAGKSILSSANNEGMVTSAIYSKPHIFDDGTIAFIMRKRLTYENLKTNPYASYMFIYVHRRGTWLQGDTAVNEEDKRGDG
jgi:hypothetical protein